MRRIHLFILLKRSKNLSLQYIVFVTIVSFLKTSWKLPSSLTHTHTLHKYSHSRRFKSMTSEEQIQSVTARQNIAYYVLVCVMLRMATSMRGLAMTTGANSQQSVGWAKKKEILSCIINIYSLTNCWSKFLSKNMNNKLVE